MKFSDIKLEKKNAFEVKYGESVIKVNPYLSVEQRAGFINDFEQFIVYHDSNNNDLIYNTHLVSPVIMYLFFVYFTDVEFDFNDIAKDINAIIDSTLFDVCVGVDGSVIDSFHDVSEAAIRNAFDVYEKATKYSYNRPLAAITKLVEEYGDNLKDFNFEGLSSAIERINSIQDKDIISSM